MTRRTRIRRTALAAAAAALMLTTTTGPASAERVGLDDPADASGSLSDIFAVTAIHGPKRLVVRVDVADLQPTSDGGPASMSIFVDTDRTKPGPEFRLGTGLEEGTDFQLVKMRKWKPVGGPLSCRHRVVLDFAEDQVRARINRSCLRDPVELRVGVKMTDLFDGSHPIVDWLGKPRFFTLWLNRA